MSGVHVAASVAPVLPAVSTVLQNNELLTLICQAFLPFDPPPSLPPTREELVAGRMHLRNIALVCRAFTEPAQACLWTHLDSLLPLIQLLPNARVVNGAYVRLPTLPPSEYRAQQPANPSFFSISPERLHLIVHFGVVLGEFAHSC